MTDIHAGGHKHPFTDERVGSLLGDLMRATFNGEAVSFKEGENYKYELYFTVKDEYLIIGKNRMIKLKGEGNEGLECGAP